MLSMIAIVTLLTLLVLTTLLTLLTLLMLMTLPTLLASASGCGRSEKNPSWTLSPAETSSPTSPRPLPMSSCSGVDENADVPAGPLPHEAHIRSHGTDLRRDDACPPEWWRSRCGSACVPSPCGNQISGRNTEAGNEWEGRRLLV